MKFLSDKDRRKAFIATVLFHLILILGLIFMALTTPLPLPGEEGVEVDLGYSDQGSGWEQPDLSVPESAPPPVPAVQKSEPEPVEEEELVTEDNNEMPQLEETVEEKPEEQPEIEQKEEVIPEEEVQEEVEEIPEEIPEEPKPVVNQRALFKGATSSNTESSEGITGKPGDQGRPEGLRDVKRYEGQGGQGDGPSYSLGGRGAKYLAVPTHEFKEQGDVVVEIWVDRMGIVKKAQVSAKGTTIIDPNMRNLAVRAALNSTFSEDPTAGELQKGTITYTFIIRR
ncbi:MAG: hypothetical protein PF694_10795 [Bacteroidetes bacterium]|jgi:outer membrane biosynthesis protein TonB|nr:hypothetical protein [Bacteroidota bacterium]